MNFGVREVWGVFANGEVIEDIPEDKYGPSSVRQPADGASGPWLPERNWGIDCNLSGGEDRNVKSPSRSSYCPGTSPKALSLLNKTPMSIGFTR